MKCVSCGEELAEGTLLCPKCGRAVEEADVARQKAAAGQLTKKEFYKLSGVKNCRTSILSSAVVLYICGGATLLASVLLSDVLAASIIDGILLLLLGLWLQLGKSRVCAIITLVYGIFNLVIVMMQSGRLQGWWILAAGIWAVIHTFRFNSMWNKYRKEGIIPKDALER